MFIYWAFLSLLLSLYYLALFKYPAGFIQFYPFLLFIMCYYSKTCVVSQSRPSFRPSPVSAQHPYIFQQWFYISSKLYISLSSAGDLEVGRSCLLARIRIEAFLSSWLTSKLKNSALLVIYWLSSAESTTYITA